MLFRSGLKLLQLPPPQSALLRPPPPVAVREAWGPQPLHLNLSQYESSVIRRAEEDSRRCAEPTAPRAHLNLNQYCRQAQLCVRKVPSMREAEREAVRLPPAPQTGLPLLRFPPASQTQHIQLPHMPFFAPVKQPKLGHTAVGHYPRLHLLHAEPDPPSAVSSSALYTQNISSEKINCVGILNMSRSMSKDIDDSRIVKKAL